MDLLAERYGIELEVDAPLESQGESVSSTAIAELDRLMHMSSVEAR